MSWELGTRIGLGGLDEGVAAIYALAVLSVVGALVSFLVAVEYTVFPLLLFIAVVAVGWFTRQDHTARVVMFLMTASTIVILGLITIYLVIQSIPVFQKMGLRAIVGTSQPIWSTSQNVYSLAPMIWGTRITTAIAMSIAAPLGVAGALFISEIAPSWAREILKPAVEMLAGVPSIVYGFIGYVILNGYMMEELSLPTFGSLFVVGIVIGVMALPTVVSVAEDAIASIPRSMKDGSLALGATDWQTIKSVTFPAAFSGISAAVLLGVGRAVGETMAATVILGNLPQFPDPLIDVFGNTITLTSLIASQYGVASGLQLSALFAAGVVLFVAVLFLSIASQLIEAHMKRKLGGSE